MTQQNNFYCSQKFWWLTVDPERQSLASCCAADEQRIDLSWLKNNPGQIFNTPLLQQERQDMLNNIPVKSCENTCWNPEKRGIPSNRQIRNTVNDQRYSNVNADPQMLHLVIGADCNLTCSYCTKQFSTAWLRDIANNGTYFDKWTDDDRFTITSKDKVTLKIGLKSIINSQSYNLLMSEVAKINTASSAQITGGEPFLYSNLVEVVNKLQVPKVEIFSGLGVTPQRFASILSRLPDHVTIIVSAENVGELYEFNRYGNKFENFCINLAAIRKRGFGIKFSSVLSNLTVMGFKEFQDRFSTEDDYFNICINPHYLTANLIDDQTRDIINNTSFKFKDAEIKQAVNVESNPEHVTNLKKFLPEFAKRRQLSIEIFPESFKKWILE